MRVFFFFSFYGELDLHPAIKEAFLVIFGKKLLSDGYCDLEEYLHTRFDKEKLRAQLTEMNSPFAGLYRRAYPASAEEARSLWNSFEEESLRGEYVRDGEGMGRFAMDPIEAKAVVNWVYRAYPRLENRREITRKQLGDFQQLFGVGELAFADSVIYLKSKVEVNVISSFGEFCKTVQEIGSPKHSFYYRGHADSGYLLLPSVMRRSGWAWHERDMYNEVLIECPQEFANCTTHLERLVHMQHYGLPTRLLDITRNPLVALYFACEGSPATQGEVIVFDVESRRVKYPGSDTVSILASLPLLSRERQTQLRKLAANPSVSAADFNRQAAPLLHEVKLEKPAFRDEIAKEELGSCFFVLSEKKNSRIVKQDGAFIICGLFEERENPINRYRYQSSKKMQVYLIRARAKPGILAMLNRFSINRAALFPEISDVTAFIKGKY